MTGLFLAACAGIAHAEGIPPGGITALIEDAARVELRQLAEHEEWLEPEYELEVATGSRPLPDCTGPVQVRPRDTRSAARMRFVVECESDTPWRRDAVVRAVVSARVVVAVGSIAANRPIADDELALERRVITRTPDVLDDPLAVAGMSSRRALRNGDVLRKRMLVAPTLVRRGDVVRIVAQRQHVVVTTSGEALEAGGRGEVVRVRNSGSGKVIHARIIESGTVEPVTR